MGEVRSDVLATLIEESSKLASDAIRLAIMSTRKPALAAPPQEAQGAPVSPSLPTTEETVRELRRRLAKELYRMEMDLQTGARFAGKPCDCLGKKHNLGVEATAEELMSYESNPVYGKCVAWLRKHEAEFEPGEIARRPPEHYRALAPEVRAFRKEVLGTEKVVRELEEGGNPGNPGKPRPALRLGPPLSRPFERSETPRRRRLPPGVRLELITPEEEGHIREYHAQGLVYRQIAERMGRSVSTVYRTIHRGGPPQRRAITPQRIQESMGLRRMGLTLEEIGRKLGLSKTTIAYVLRRAGEQLDLAAEAERLRRELLAVGDRLRPPATLSKLENGADQLREIGDEARGLIEIKPPEVSEALGTVLSEVHSVALLAEEILRTGAWCLRASEMEELPPFPPLPDEHPGRPMGMPGKPIKVTPLYRQELKACAEASRDSARGWIEGREGYEVKAAAAIFEGEKLITEEKEKVPA